MTNDGFNRLRHKLVDFICNHYTDAKKFKAEAKLWNLCHSIIKAYKEKFRHVRVNIHSHNLPRQQIKHRIFSFLDVAGFT